MAGRFEGAIFAVVEVVELSEVLKMNYVGGQKIAKRAGMACSLSRKAEMALVRSSFGRKAASDSMFPFPCQEGQSELPTL